MSRKISRRDIHEKESKNNNEANIWKLSLRKAKETKPSWKPDCNGVALPGNGVALSGNIFSTLISMAKSL